MIALVDYPNEGRGMEGYFAFLRERYNILLRRRRGDPAPWTEDPVLQAWRFCNVRREDDKVTVWFRENIRDLLKEDPKVFFATIAFRWFNTIFTGEYLKPYLLEGRWPREQIEYMLSSYQAEGASLFTGAFMINSAPGKPKHIDVLDNLDWARANLSPERFSNYTKLNGSQIQYPRGWTKREMMDHVLQVPRLGNFAAYQVVVDLQYTYLLENAPDLNTFTVAGPGCAKGLGLMVTNDPKQYRYGAKGDQEKMLNVMRYCREASLDPKLWPSEWPPFVLSDIENGFCEYAKWRSGHEGSRLKRKFTPSA